jgi:hypothetical protein
MVGENPRVLIDQFSGVSVSVVWRRADLASKPSDCDPDNLGRRWRARLGLCSDFRVSGC